MDSVINYEQIKVAIESECSTAKRNLDELRDRILDQLRTEHRVLLPSSMTDLLERASVTWSRKIQVVADPCVVGHTDALVDVQVVAVSGSVFTRCNPPMFHQSDKLLPRARCGRYTLVAFLLPDLDPSEPRAVSTDCPTG